MAADTYLLVRDHQAWVVLDPGTSPMVDLTPDAAEHLGNRLIALAAVARQHHDNPPAGIAERTAGNPSVAG